MLYRGYPLWGGAPHGGSCTLMGGLSHILGAVPCNRVDITARGLPPIAGLCALCWGLFPAVALAPHPE